jgi:hypothetical protein
MLNATCMASALCRSRVCLTAALLNPLSYLNVLSVSNPNDANDWQLMSSIKSNILRRMDKATPGVRICCVKFLQQVVLVQTPGVVDPRVRTTDHGASTARSQPTET